MDGRTDGGGVLVVGFLRLFLFFPHSSSVDELCAEFDCAPGFVFRRGLGIEC